MLVSLFLTISTFVLKRALRQLSPISILAQSLEWLFPREYNNFGKRRRNFVHKLSSAVHTSTAISNPCLPITNYVITQLKRSTTRAAHFMKKN